YASGASWMASVFRSTFQRFLPVAALEVGTEPVERAFGALRNRKWLEKYGVFDSPETPPILEEMHACLAPGDVEWRSATLSAGRKALDAAVAGIARGD
ncbi:MAG: hypothetical protein ABIV36_09095, partial [Sphingobium limneticum]